MKSLPPFILIEETIEKFGYDPTILKGKEAYTKLIVRTCFDCKNIYDQQLQTAIRAYHENKKCKYCANKERALLHAKENGIKHKQRLKSGELIHSRKGVSHSEETKQKIREYNTGLTLELKVGKEKADQLKKEASNRFSGVNNPFYGKKHTPESIEKMTIKSRENVRRGKDSNFYGKKYWPDRKLFNYNNVLFRSNWEVKTVQYFDQNNIEWQYESKVFELGNTTYTPDFYLINENKWIEVKGYWYDDAKEKFELFKQLYPQINIEIWDQQKLKELKII